MRSSLFRRWCLAILLLIVSPAHAIEKLQLLAGDWQYGNISAKDSQLQLQLTANGLAVELSIATLQLAQPFGEVNNIQLHCQQARLQSGQISCAKGQVSFAHAHLGDQTVTFSLQARYEEEHYQIQVSGLSLADGTLDIQAELDGEVWQANIQSHSVTLESLESLALSMLTEDLIELAQGWQLQGELNGKLMMAGDASNISRIETDLALHQWSVSDPQSRYVTEAANARVQLKARQQAGEWRWSNIMTLHGGQAYFEPVFLDFEQSGMHWKSDGHWSPDNDLITLNIPEFEHSGTLQGSVSLHYQHQQVTSLQIKLDKAQLNNVYNTWLQPFLLGTAADSLTLDGSLSADVDYQHGQSPELSLSFSDVDIHDQQQRFSLAGLTGEFAWTGSVEPQHTALSWQQIYFYALPLGASAIDGISTSSGFRLTQPFVLPVMDGALQIHDFSLSLDQEQAVSWQFDGLLTPVSMEAVSEVLGWPTLYGRLSGVIPQVRYQYQQVQVDGALMLRLFDGITVIRDLRLQDPFGALPQLSANVDITGLDLQLLTQAFDFGMISGRLDGRIHELRLAGWQAVQFDAQFATPQGDRSRRRISQQAVDNLSQIGGGASGVLSRSFLRFFEDFSYQQLGLSCTLRNSVCEMSGVADAEHGYYIVQGGGILPPWINVVGYTRRVDWPDLLERLQAVRHSSGPVIE